MKRVIETYDGDTAPVRDCVMITHGVYKGSFCLISEAIVEEYFTILDPCIMELPSQVVETTEGDFRLKEDCIQFNCGPYDGGWAENDDPDVIRVEYNRYRWGQRTERKDYIFHSDDPPEFIVYTLEEQWAHQNDTHYINIGLNEGEYCLCENSTSSGCGEYVWWERDGSPDSMVYCESSGDYFHESEVRYCDHCNESYHEDDEDSSHSGCGNGSPGTIQPYQSRSIPWEFKGRGKYRIGFEVEKTDIDGENQEGENCPEEPFFAYWETDSSCGVEGSSHIYGLSDDGRERIVRDIARSPIGVRADTSDDCGGHINISSDDYNNLTKERVRPYICAFYAIYRHRLKNDYCNKDLRLLFQEWQEDTKYRSVRFKRGGILEIRIPPRVKGPNQLVNRFDLCRVFTEAIDEQISLRQYVRRLDPVLSTMYKNNPERKNEVRQMIRHFSEYIETGYINFAIADFIDVAA